MREACRNPNIEPVSSWEKGPTSRKDARFAIVSRKLHSTPRNK